MGRQGASQPSTGSGNGGGGGRAAKGQDDDRETERRIKEHNEKRGGSLLKAHKQAGRGKEEDDPSKREFDREKDMGLGTKIGEAKKREMVKRAGDFTSRFEKGKYL